MFTIIHLYSTIFKTIDDETTISGQRIVGALQARKIAQEQATAQLEIDIACLKKYEIACQSGSVSTEQFDSIMKKSSVTAKEYTTNIQKGTGSAQSYAQAQKANNAALQSVGIGAGIASKAVKLLSATMNTIAFTAIFSLISKGISWVTEQIDNYIHRNEIAIEKAEELLDTFKSEIDTINSNQDKINGYADEFKELSRGVDDLGRNVSLTADEYARYQSIVKEIVGINPSLISGYDEENNILADKNDLIEASIQLLKDEYNQKLKNLALPDNIDTAIEGAIGRYNSSKEDFLEVKIPTTLAFSGVKIDENGNRKTGYVNQISQYIEDVIGVEFTGWEGGINQYILDNAEAIFDNLDQIKERASQTKDGWEGLNDSQLIDLMDYFKELRIAYNDMNKATTSANPTLQYVAMAEDSYSQLTDIQKKFVTDYVNGIQITSETTKQEKDNIRKSIISLTQELSKLDDSEVNNALTNLYAIPTDEQSITEFVEQFRNALEVIQEYCEENSIKIPIDIFNNDITQFQNSIRQITGDNGISFIYLSEYTKDFTVAQAKLWLEATLGAENATQAIEMYEAALADVTEAARSTSLSLSIPETIDQLNTQIKPAFDSLKSAWQDIFTDDGFELNSIDILSTCDSIKSKLDDMSELGLSIDYSSYEDFVRVLSNSESTENDVKYAFDSLATSITKAGLSGVEDFETMKAALEDLGVVNNEIVAFQALIGNTDILEETVKQAGLTMDEFVISTEDGTIAASDAAQAFIEEMIGAENCEQALALLQLQQMIFNENGLDTAQDINSCYQLAQAAGIATEAIAELAGLSTAYESVSAAGNTHAAAAIASQMEAVRARVQTQFAELSEVDFSGVDKSKSSKSSSKDTAETFDWIEQAITNVENEIKELDGIANSSYSTLSEKNEALAQEISKVIDEITLQQQAYDAYMQKAEAVGLSDHYKDLVQNGAIGMEDIADQTLQSQINEYQKWYDKAQSTLDAMRDLKNDQKDLHVNAYELQAAELKDRLDKNALTERQYLDELKAVYTRFYGNLTDYAQQYHEAVLDYLAQEKDYLNNVAGSATYLLDTEIDRIREDATRQEESLKQQIELLNDRKKPLQDELDALEDKAKRENLILNLQKAQYDLARAENQRTKLIYTEESGMVYTSDTSAVRDAKKGVDDARLEIQKQSIQDQIDLLDHEIDKYNDLIDQINTAADRQINALEQIKDKWQEVIDQQEYAKNISLLTSEFGADAIGMILSGNDDVLLAQWKQSYINTLAEMDMESQGYIGSLTEQMASLYGMDLSPWQAQFQDVTDCVNDVTNAFYETDTAMESFDRHTENLTNEVIPAIHSAAEEMNQFNTAANLDIEKTVTITYLTTGEKPAPDGTPGSAVHAEGTAKVTGDWGVRRAGKALVGELGQEMVVSADGTWRTVGDHGAEFVNLRENDIVFNHLQTQELLRGGTLSTPHNTNTAIPSPALHPIEPGDRAWQLQEQVQPLLENVNENLDMLSGSAMLEHGRQMEQMLTDLHASSVINHSNVQPNIHVDAITITCPGVTSQEVMKEVGAALEETFRGFHTYADQQSLIR